MTLQPTDPQLDDLLDRALAAGDVPAELQDRVLALTDPAFNTLLDEALAPDAMDDALERRVLGRVNAMLDETTDGVLASTDAVLATIGGGPSTRAWLGYAAAAAVVLATGLVFYFVADSFVAGNHGTPTPPNGPGPIVSQPDDNLPADDLESALAFNDDSELDQRLSTLESRILSVSDQPVWGGEDDFQRELWLELAPDDEAEALLF